MCINWQAVAAIVSSLAVCAAVWQAIVAHKQNRELREQNKELHNESIKMSEKFHEQNLMLENKRIIHDTFNYFQINSVDITLNPPKENDYEADITLVPLDFKGTTSALSNLNYINLTFFLRGNAIRDIPVNEIELKSIWLKFRPKAPDKMYYCHHELKGRTAQSYKMHSNNLNFNHRFTFFARLYYWNSEDLDNIKRYLTNTAEKIILDISLSHINILDVRVPLSHILELSYDKSSHEGSYSFTAEDNIHFSHLPIDIKPQDPPPQS